MLMTFSYEKTEIRRLHLKIFNRNISELAPELSFLGLVKIMDFRAVWLHYEKAILGGEKGQDAFVTPH